MQTWALRSAIPISSLDSFDADSLEFLRHTVAQKRLVLLGESSHGVEEYMKFKLHAIRFLHEEMGFNVIAFESSLLECWKANRSMTPTSSPGKIMKSIYSVWHSDATRELFEYVASTLDSDRPLQLAGFDIDQSNSDWNEAIEFMLEIVPDSEAEMKAELSVTRAGFEDNSGYDEERNRRMAAVAQRFDHLRDRSSGNARTDFALAAQLARSLIAQAKFPTLGKADRRALRDSVMAENVTSLAESAFPGEKIVVWAHNAHIDKRASQRRLADRSAETLRFRLDEARGVTMMGEILHARYGSSSYVVGLFMASGTYRTQNGNSRVRRLRRDSIEFLLHEADVAATYMDFATNADPIGRRWLTSRTRVLYAGPYWYSIVPAQHFDAVVVITNANVPGD